MAQRIACLRKKDIQKSFFYFAFLENRKKATLLSQGSLNFSLKDVLRLKQKTTLFPDSDIYTRYYPIRAPHLI